MTAPTDYVKLADELNDLLAKATPVPWVCRNPDNYEQSSICGRDFEQTALTVNGSAIPGRTTANGALIVALVNAAPAIVEALRDNAGWRLKANVQWNALEGSASLHVEQIRKIKLLRGALEAIGHSLVCGPVDRAEHNASELCKAGEIARDALSRTGDA